MTTDSSDDQEITNSERAERCHGVLETYNDEYDVLSNLIDLLADARHWCDRNGTSYADLDRTAYQHYLEERSAELSGPATEVAILAETPGPDGEA